MLKTIVVALDNSNLSDRVVQALDHVSIQATTTIILTHVFAPPAEAHDVERPHQPPETLFKIIESRLKAYQKQLPGQSEIEIMNGEPAEEIIRLANIHQADLIVLGNRGLTGMKRIIEGSVSSQVVAEAPCSVLVVS